MLFGASEHLFSLPRGNRRRSELRVFELIKALDKLLEWFSTEEVDLLLGRGVLREALDQEISF